MNERVFLLVHVRPAPWYFRQMEHGLRTTVRLVSTQYVWRYVKDVNGHRYVRIPAGTLCTVRRYDGCPEAPSYHIVTDDEYKLQVSPSVLEPA